MSKAKIMPVQTRLQREAFQPGGMTHAEALGRAETGLERMRAPCEATIDEALAKIEARFGPAAGAGRASEAFADLSRLALRIIDASIFASAYGLDQAALALHRAAERCAARSAWDWVAIDLHIAAVRMLRSEGPRLAPETRKAVIEGLGRVASKRLGATCD